MVTAFNFGQYFDNYNSSFKHIITDRINILPSEMERPMSKNTTSDFMAGFLVSLDFHLNYNLQCTHKLNSLHGMVLVLQTNFKDVLHRSPGLTL